MSESRIFGIVGVIVVLVATVYETWNIFRVLELVSEAVGPELQAIVRDDVTLNCVIAATFVARLVTLGFSRRIPNLLVSLSWVAASLMIVFYVWRKAPGTSESCNSEGICFTFYDATYGPDIIAIAGMVYIFFGLCKIVVVGLLALFQPRYK